MNGSRVFCEYVASTKQCTEHGTETIVLNGQSYHKGTRILKPTTLSILKISLIFASEH